MKLYGIPYQWLKSDVSHFTAEISVVNEGTPEMAVSTTYFDRLDMKQLKKKFNPTNTWTKIEATPYCVLE